MSDSNTTTVRRSAQNKRQKRDTDSASDVDEEEEEEDYARDKRRVQELLDTPNLTKSLRLCLQTWYDQEPNPGRLNGHGYDSRMFLPGKGDTTVDNLGVADHESYQRTEAYKNIPGGMKVFYYHYTPVLELDTNQVVAGDPDEEQAATDTAPGAAQGKWKVHLQIDGYDPQIPIGFVRKDFRPQDQMHRDEKDLYRTWLQEQVRKMRSTGPDVVFKYQDPEMQKIEIIEGIQQAVQTLDGQVVFIVGLASIGTSYEAVNPHTGDKGDFSDYDSW